MKKKSEKIPFILLSGMGADDRVFAPQKVAFPHLVVPEWIDPFPGESLAEYGKRFAEKIDPGEPCFIGGASFGGMVAVEMAKHLDAKACFLIGSVRNADELRPLIRWFRPFRGVAALIPFPMIQFGCRIVDRCFGGILKPFHREILSQGIQSDSALLRWATSAILAWDHTKEKVTNTPVFHIHGRIDRILPVGCVSPDKIVEGGHVISLTRSAEVNEFLREKMEETTMATPPKKSW